MPCLFSHDVCAYAHVWVTPAALDYVLAQCKARGVRAIIPLLTYWTQNDSVPAVVHWLGSWQAHNFTTSLKWTVQCTLQFSRWCNLTSLDFFFNDTCSRFLFKQHMEVCVLLCMRNLIEEAISYVHCTFAGCREPPEPLNRLALSQWHYHSCMEFAEWTKVCNGHFFTYSLLILLSQRSVICCEGAKVKAAQSMFRNGLKTFLLTWRFANQWLLYGCFHRGHCTVSHNWKCQQMLDPNHLVTTGFEGFYSSSSTRATFNPGGMGDDYAVAVTVLTCCKAHSPLFLDYSLFLEPWGHWASNTGQDFIANHSPASIDFAVAHVW